MKIDPNLAQEIKKFTSQMALSGKNVHFDTVDQFMQYAEEQEAAERIHESLMATDSMKFNLIADIVLPYVRED